GLPDRPDLLLRRLLAPAGNRHEQQKPDDGGAPAAEPGPLRHGPSSLSAAPPRRVLRADFARAALHVQRGGAAQPCRTRNCPTRCASASPSRRASATSSARLPSMAAWTPAPA